MFNLNQFRNIYTIISYFMVNKEYKNKLIDQLYLIFIIKYIFVLNQILEIIHTILLFTIFKSTNNIMYSIVQSLMGGYFLLVCLIPRISKKNIIFHPCFSFSYKNISILPQGQVSLATLRCSSNLHYYTMIMQRISIIMGDAGFKPHNSGALFHYAVV